MPNRILIAPLHWGLGHATRCIPIIREQLSQGNEVIIAAELGPKALLQQHFPELEFVSIPFKEITYPANRSMSMHFFWNGPSLLLSIWKEHHALKKLVQNRGIDLVISDSRFGCWATGAKSVFITHQLEIKSPAFSSIINAMNRWVMNRYDEVWIPDYAEFPGLAGELSHPRKPQKNAKYIGPLSRFTAPIKAVNSKWKAVILVSGPEPHRSAFEAEMARRFIESGENALLLKGKPHEDSKTEMENLRLVNHLSDDTLISELSQCEMVISRSGYSTIMDMHVLGLKTEYHPTPGQTEQEYLAQLQKTKGA